MTLLWIVTGVSVLVALVAWSTARRTAKRLEQLSQMYWALKYQHSELRVRLERSSGAAPPAEEPGPPAGPQGAFVPLSSLKR